jgi:restriction system protein
VPIPTYDALMLPVLRHCAEKTWAMRDLVARIADDSKLTEEERRQETPGGGTILIAGRVHWAKTYLKQAGLVTQPKRGMVQISPRGRDVLNKNPAKIDTVLLQQFEEFRVFAGAKPNSGPIELTAVLLAAPVDASSTPEEQITAASKELDQALRDALLVRILEATPTFFERLIIDLLVKMGYGGSRTDAGEHLGGTGDGGIDGLIREDQLGLDRVYLQAKRYKPGNTVGPETVQAFIGALVGRGAQKGVLITTSTFTKAALSAANQSGHLRIVLVDGDELTNLMVRFDVGIRVARTVAIKRIDPAYFGDVELE